MLTIITPVVNNLFYTKQFLRSLDRQTDKDFAVIIVDNASTDGTKEYLEGWVFGHSTRHTVENITNRGYAGGCNDGITAAETLYPGTHALITNNDMELAPNCIAELKKAIEQYPDGGVFGGRLLFPDGKIQHAGAFLGPLGWGSHKGAGLPDSQYIESEVTEEEYVTGALFLITNQALQVVPRFDEQFNPAYFEEVDYCYSLRKNSGLKVYYVPSVKAVHYENKTSNDILKSKEGVRQLSDANEIKFWLKHDVSAAEYKVTSPEKALITGKIYGDWSFSIVLRNLAKGLKRNGVDVAIAPEEYHQPGYMDDWEIQEMIRKPKDYWDRSVLRSSEGDHQYLLPPGKKRLAHTTFEGSRLHKAWVDQLNHVDTVVTNSTFCQNNMREFGVVVPISVVPNPVDLELWNSSVKPLALGIKSSFKFVSVFAYGERKAPEILIKAFIEEFDRSEDVSLSIHSLSMFYVLQQSGLSPQQWLMKIMGGKDTPHAPIYLTSNSFHPTTLPQFYKAHDCFVLPSRCEGFGNGLVEAATMGLPSIATNYSGMTDFINSEVGFPLDYRLVDMPLQHLPYFRNYVGCQWAEPSIEHLKKLMRYAFEHKDEVKKKGALAMAKAQQYDITVVGRKLAEAMFS